MGVAGGRDCGQGWPTVICQGGTDHCRVKFKYRGIQDCIAAALVGDGNKACQYACLGLGNCERVCPFDAIHIDPALHIAVVNEDKCQSCGKCIDECPKEVLELRPENQLGRHALPHPGDGQDRQHRSAPRAASAASAAPRPASSTPSPS